MNPNDNSRSAAVAGLELLLKEQHEHQVQELREEIIGTDCDHREDGMIDIRHFRH